MSLLAFDTVTVRRGATLALDRVTARIDAGELVALLGPNGAGKTTLLRAALGLQPSRGRITLGGADLAGLAPRDRARRAAYVPQAHEIAWPITVEALVGLGRLPHRTSREADRVATDAALVATDLLTLRHRPATALSGGERARALIARALAQAAPLLVADEPTAGLDPAHQLALMATLRSLAREGRGVLVALHDLGLAVRWCDRVILLQTGRVAADGPPAAVLDAATLAAVYGVTAHFGGDTGGPILVPTGLATP